MDKELKCFVDMFAREQTVLFKDKKIKLNSDDLLSALTNICYDENIDVMHLFGNDLYLEGLVSKVSIPTDNIIEYNQKKIEVKIN